MRFAQQLASREHFDVIPVVRQQLPATVWTDDDRGGARGVERVAVSA